MLIIAHRGASTEAIENSWHSFELAVQAESDRIELDVQLSADGRPFIMHDENLIRTTGQHGSLSQMSAKQLEKIKLLNGENIPQLADVLFHFLPAIEINIELKSRHWQTAEVVAQLVLKSSYPQKAIISSFHPHLLQYLREKHPHLHCASLWGRSTLRVSPLYRFFPQLMMKKNRTSIIHPDVELLSPSFLAQAHSRRWQVFTYVSLAYETKYREKIWENLYQASIEGHCTNFPREFKGWLWKKNIRAMS